MQKSNNLTPVRFDDKDIIVDGTLWDNLFWAEQYISFCTSENYYKALFFLPSMQGDRAFKAHILSNQWSIISVTCLQDNGTIWMEDVDKLKAIFTSYNDDKDSDIYVQCITHQEKDGRYTELEFQFFHTT